MISDRNRHQVLGLADLVIALDHIEHLFDTGVEGWRAEQQRQETKAWSPGQAIPPPHR
jgi:hypothetical protein